MEKKNGEKMELSHEPVQGYRPVFFIAISIGSLYLAIVFAKTMF